jgi:hypothetical protein
MMPTPNATNKPQFLADQAAKAVASDFAVPVVKVADVVLGLDVDDAVTPGVERVTPCNPVPPEIENVGE